MQGTITLDFNIFPREKGPESESFYYAQSMIIDKAFVKNNQLS